jgi:hypothetical protein
VLPKKSKFKASIEDMADNICKNFTINGRLQCGIVYCLSRNDCEKVAKELQVGLMSCVCGVPMYSPSSLGQLTPHLLCVLRILLVAFLKTFDAGHSTDR